MRCWLCSLVVFLLLAAGLAQRPSGVGPRVPTATRLVVLFTRLENDLLQAAQHKDAVALETMLAADFEVWTPAPPGDPIPREQWISEAGRSAGPFEISRMAVRNFGEVNVVSFVLGSVDAVGKSGSGGFFIVDVWVKSGDGWKLSSRYRSAVMEAKPSPRRPTGKE